MRVCRSPSPSLLLVTLGLLAVTLLAHSAGVAASQCSWKDYDLSPLMGVAFPGKESSSSARDRSYYISVCNPLSALPSLPAEAQACAKAGGGDRRNASLCRVDAKTPGSSEDLGEWGSAPEARWNHIDPLQPTMGVIYTLQGAEQCWVPEEGRVVPYTSTVRFGCSSVQEQSFTVQQGYGPRGACNYNMTMRTPLACPDRPKVCAWNGFDFSALVGREFPGTDGGSLYSYALSICAPLSPNGKGAKCAAMSRGASACQVSADGSAWEIGRWGSASSASWDWADQSAPWKGVSYTIKGAETCWASGSHPEAYTARVQLICSRTQGEVVTVKQESGGCTQTYTLATPLACPDATKATRGEGKQGQPKIRLSEQ